MLGRPELVLLREIRQQSATEYGAPRLREPHRHVDEEVGCNAQRWARALGERRYDDDASPTLSFFDKRQEVSIACDEEGDLEVAQIRMGEQVASKRDVDALRATV